MSERERGTERGDRDREKEGWREERVIEGKREWERVREWEREGHKNPQHRQSWNKSSSASHRGNA